MNDKLLRPLIIVFVCALHLAVIFFLAIESKKTIYEGQESARVMKVTDIAEFIPPIEVIQTLEIVQPSAAPVPASYSVIPHTEGIAESMIETDTPIDFTGGPAGAYSTQPQGQVYENYFAMHQISKPPVFNENAFIADIIYPQIAHRSGIEGRVILELFVDRTGVIQRVTVLLEDPADRGFGEAAVRAFTGKKGEPAYANNEPVSCRYRYPFYFTIK